jgi:hypothetical protein
MLPDIAIVGKAGTGKTTAAEYLVEYQDYLRESFGQPIKDICMALFGKLERDAMQSMGLVARSVDPYVFVRLLDRRIAERPEAAPFVVDDLRYETEASYAEGEGFVMVRITAPPLVRQARLQQLGKWTGEVAMHHVSETELDSYPCKYTYQNSGDVLGLYEFLEGVLRKERR